MSAGVVPGRTQQQTATTRDSSPFLRPRALPSQRSLPVGNSCGTLAEEGHTQQKHNAAAGWNKGLQPVSEVSMQGSPAVQLWHTFRAIQRAVW